MEILNYSLFPPSLISLLHISFSHLVHSSLIVSVHLEKKCDFKIHILKNIFKLSIQKSYKQFSTFLAALPPHMKSYTCEQNKWNTGLPTNDFRYLTYHRELPSDGCTVIDTQYGKRPKWSINDIAAWYLCQDYVKIYCDIIDCFTASRTNMISQPNINRICCKSYLVQGF